MPERYFLKRGEQEPWCEVSREDFAEAERLAGLKPDWNAAPGEFASSGFGAFNIPPGVWLHGRIVHDETDPSTYEHEPDFREVAWPIEG